MNATATADELRVNRLAELDNDPELAYAVSQATKFLRELVQLHHLDPARRELMWGGGGEPPFQSVNAHLRETDDYGSRQADRNLSRQRMLDPLARDGLMSYLLMDVLRQRWYQIGDAINRGIDQLEREESADGEPRSE